MKTLWSAAVALLFVFSSPLFAEEKLFTIIHTNDMHSHLMAFPPELDYTSDRTGDDATIGGWARVATVIRQEKAKKKNPVLILDAGDFTMGSLFHMLAREEAIELRLMKDMGYDYVTLGNHEFDLMPRGLARILNTAARAGMPQILFTGAQFSAESPKDDTLEAAFKKGLVKPYTVRTMQGLKVGLFGLMGHVAAVDSPFASPVKFRDKIEVAREMVKLLREQEKADMVICISHSGLYEGTESEDERLAKEVPGIDVIVSGHTHTNLEKPVIIGKTIIVQAYEYGKRVGVLDFAWNGSGAVLKNYRHVFVDDSIPANAAIQKRIDAFIGEIDRRVLKAHGLSYWEIVASTGFDMTLVEEESGLGNLIADSIRWYVNKHDYDPKDPSTKVVFAVESNGVIRDDLIKGRTGRVSVADLFRTIPLGIGMDDTMAYPLITCYFHASEIKKALEVLTSVYPLKGSNYFIQVSGVKFTYNPRRVLFDRVTEIWMGSEEEGYALLDYSSKNTKLYRISANIYDATFLKIIGNFTFHILDIVPKDRNGKPIEDLVAFRVDADKARPGIQELKEWVGVMEYVQSFKDTNGDGISDMPDKYGKKLGRIVSESSLNPIKLLSRGTKVTWIACAVLLIVILLVVAVVWVVIKKLKK